MSEQNIIPFVNFESITNVRLGSKSLISIYLFSCCLFTGTFILSFFCSVSITIKSPGVIRPSAEVGSIRSLVNGRIKQTYVTENGLMHKGEVLYVIESDVIEQRDQYLRARMTETEQFREDLQNLLSMESSAPKLITPLFQQTFYGYQQRINEAITRYDKAKREFARNDKLYREKVIAEVEFDNFQFELKKATTALEIEKQNQLSRWQIELQSYERELKDYATQLAELQIDKSNLIIKSPVDGNLQNVQGLYPGSLVFANQELAQISPDTSLIVEVRVRPNDIGLIQTGMRVRFQVEAFNYNQWGVGTGIVREISPDIQLINGHPIFRIRCTLDKDYLQLKNGYKGYLKKGMSLQARFIVAERTLWQLLSDKIDDWLNPETYRGTTNEITPFTSP